MLCAAHSRSYNERKPKMRIYSVMLEGTEDALAYFINVEVVALTPDQASTLRSKAPKNGA